MTTPRPRVFGVDLDGQTRCAHFHTELDIIAIKLKCCGEYFGCKDCHEALAEHALEQWQKHQYDTLAVLCGECDTELTIEAYLHCRSRCPACGARFNPQCINHHHFYFSEL